VIIATAGHVDHGKTTLVHALTGVHTDRLPEERRRGMTIEPGFAQLALGDGRTLSIVDVPGHADFLRQAVAGLAAVQAVLLVIACDDGPRRQTRDHLALLDLLGVRRGAVVLSKADRVDGMRLATLQAEVDALLADSALRTAPRLPVSATTGQGLEALRTLLGDWAASPPERPPGARLRFAIDRAFSPPGIGTVVTGTVLSGTVKAGDAPVLSPDGTPVRVRSLQRHGQPAEQADAGERCALALAGAALDRLGRGHWLLHPDLHAPATRLDTRLRLLADAPRALEGSVTAPLRLYLGTAAVGARVLPLSPGRLAPGEQGLVQLLLDAPVAALHGDRFVLHDTAAQALVGGGRVLDPDPPRRGRASDARLTELQALDHEDAATALAGLLDARPQGVDPQAFARQRNLDPAALAHLGGDEAVTAVTTPRGTRWLATDRWQRLQRSLTDALDAWHAERPDSRGPGEAVLLKAVQDPTAQGMDRPLRLAALHAALAAGAVDRDGFALRRPGHVARLGQADAGLLAQLRTVMAPMGLRPPPLGDLAALLQRPVPDTLQALQRLCDLGHLVQVARNRYFLPETVDALMQVARDTAAAASDGRFEAASFRDRSGVGRNLSIQLLEFFDRIGFTRYARERRTIR
jgi:selenocysteine-specific elongation factor